VFLGQNGLPGAPGRIIYTLPLLMKTIGQYLTRFCGVPKNKKIFLGPI
jgi:hypothetical protein